MDLNVDEKWRGGHNLKVMRGQQRQNKDKWGRRLKCVNVKSHVFCSTACIVLLWPADGAVKQRQGFQLPQQFSKPSGFSVVFSEQFLNPHLMTEIGYFSLCNWVFTLLMYIYYKFNVFHIPPFYKEFYPTLLQCRFLFDYSYINKVWRCWHMKYLCTLNCFSIIL